jgi:uncharacterized iron-regulated membrane protein
MSTILRDHATIGDQASPETSPMVAPASTTRPTRARVHHAMLLVHRYVGLSIATFVFVAALTGSVLVFFHELDAWVSPWHRVTPPTPDAPFMDPFVLRDKIAAELPGAYAEVHFDPKPGEALTVWAKIAPDRWRQHYVDPYTGAVLGSREWGAISEGTHNLFTFIYRLHYQLALGTVGTWLFGIVALLWTIDCFIGMYLTFPAARRAQHGDGRSWLARWKPAWLVKGGSLFGAVFTFHRASGLWVWPLLFVFAWSAVGFNLRPVFTPVMSLFGTTDVHGSLPHLNPPKDNPALGWHEAHAKAKVLMAAEAERRGVTGIVEDHLGYDAEHGAYHYSVHSSLDLTDRWPGTAVYLDGDTGAPLGFQAPTGVAVGDTLSSWLFALHMGTVGGLAYRLVVCVMGLGIATLCVTGVWIWWRKRALRQKAGADLTRNDHATTAAARRR